MRWNGEPLKQKLFPDLFCCLETSLIAAKLSPWQPDWLHPFPRIVTFAEVKVPPSPSLLIPGKSPGFPESAFILSAPRVIPLYLGSGLLSSPNVA